MRLRSQRRRAAAVVGALALTLAVLTACSPGSTADVPEQADVQLPDETVAQLEEAVTSAMASTGSSGAIVGVWAPWSGSWVAGLGTQTPDGAAVSVDMVFPAGRVTRAMTCDVLYQLAAEGKVALDDSVSDYVAGVPDLADVTLQQLCDSTSGIGTYGDRLSSQWGKNPERTWNPRELASYGLGRSRGEAGVKYRDSDAGYILLGLALERATQQSAADLIDEYVADRLELEATGLERTSSDAPRLTGLVSPKVDGGRDCVNPVDATATSLTTGFTDSGALTDIEDLGAYAQALASRALMPDGTDRYDSLLPASGKAPSWHTVGGGAVHAGDLVGQYGARRGYITAAFADPETGMAVAVVLNNSTGGGSYGAHLAWELAAIASKAPAASGQTTPESGLPWTAETYHKAIADKPLCAPAE